MIRVIRWDPRSPIVLVFPPGTLQGQFFLGVPLGHRRPDFVSTGSHVARVRERANYWVQFSGL